jgi:hypothetical protein
MEQIMYVLVAVLCDMVRQYLAVNEQPIMSSHVYSFISFSHSSSSTLHCSYPVIHVIVQHHRIIPRSID